MSDSQTWRITLQELESQIDSNEKRITGIRAQPRDKRTIKAKLPQFQHSLQTLDNQLTIYASNPTLYNLTQSEITSFISRINALRTKLTTLDTLCNKSEENSKSALLGGNSSHYHNNNMHEGEETIDLTNQQLYNDHIIQQQNEEQQLDNISDGLTQLNDIARQQNQKLNQHSELMDNLGTNMDVANENMSTNIKRVDIVEENSRGGWFSLTIIGLLLGLIISVITKDWMCKLLPGAKCD